MADESEQITAADRERHQRFIARFHEAQQLAQQAQQLQTRANALSAGFRIWIEDLYEQYDLQQDDTIDEFGVITRRTAA